MSVQHNCLGVKFMQNRDHIKVTQKKYIENILSKFKMQEYKPITTRFDNSLKLTKNMCPKLKKEIAKE